MHTLIARILATKPGITAKKVWEILEKESELNERYFDYDYILDIVDKDGLRWRSRYKRDQHLSFASVYSTVSIFRKKLRDIGYR